MVESALQDVGPHPSETLHNPDYVERIVNRVREKTRPEHPKTLNFIVNDLHVPENFIYKDIITCDGERHLILATPEQLKHLTEVKTIFFDATFKSVKKPFMQLASIHSFVKANDTMKQVPLAFIIMSRRKTSDYKIVLKTLFDSLRTNDVI